VPSARRLSQTLAVTGVFVKVASTFLISMLLSSFAATAAEQPLLKWRSAEWASPSFPFPYESGEIQQEREGVYRLDESFEREVKPMGAVSPQAANFWRICVLSHFTAKQGLAGWAFADGPAGKMEPSASTMYFMTANSASELPERVRSGFNLTSSFQPICGKFLKADYQWW
jgi:hypothetical protein